MIDRRSRATGAAVAIVGAALFVWSLRAVGVSSVIDDVRRLGAGIVAIVLLGGARQLARAIAWRLCLDDPHELSVGAAVAAYVAGDAVGNVTPFGALISEPSKIVIVRDRIAPVDAAPALAIENLLYGASVIAMLTAGTGALLLAFDVAPAIRIASLAVVACAVGAALAGTAFLAKRAHAISGAASRLGFAGGTIREAEDRVFDFSSRHPERVLPLIALEALYHVSAVFEIWLALRLITGSAPSLLTAFVLECANRTITIVFQFVPMWLGVDEAGTGLMTTALGVGGPVGVALALARKVRVAIWTAVGLLLIAIGHRRTVLPPHDEDRHRRRDRLPWTPT